MNFLLGFYFLILYCLTLGVLLSPQKVQNDFSARFSVWTLGFIVGLSLFLWPITIILFLVHRSIKNKKIGVITKDDPGLFLNKSWQETQGVGRQPKDEVLARSSSENEKPS